jgi:hypothetical protein
MAQQTLIHFVKVHGETTTLASEGSLRIPLGKSLEKGPT